MDKIYIIQSVSGEYCSHSDKVYTSWSALITCAKVFKDYQKAYAFMRKINKTYGIKKCSVVKCTPNDVNDFTWNILSNNAN